MKKTNIILSAALAATLSLGFVSCSSDDDDDNSSANNNQVTDENVVADDASALSLVNGVYSHWQPLSSSFSFIIELNSNKLISFEGEESEAGPVNRHPGNCSETRRACSSNFRFLPYSLLRYIVIT